MATDRLRIGIVLDGDAANRREWSGTPYGILGGLRSLGVEPVPISARPPELVQRTCIAVSGLGYFGRAERSSGIRDRFRLARRMGRIGPRYASVQSTVLKRRFHAAGQLDGVIQIGTGFAVPEGAPVATYEDMTIVQRLKYPYRGEWDTLPARDVEWRINLQRECYARAHVCCLTSSWAAASVREDYAVPDAKICVVGVGSHETPRSPERAWTPPKFLFVGLDWERKSGPGVLDAFRRLRTDLPAARLDLVGEHPPTDERGVTGHGRLDRDDPRLRQALTELFDNATCFVMPSMLEPSAVVYTEAAAAGLPSIGTSIGGSGDLIGDAGLIIDPHVPDAIYRAMHEMTNGVRAAALGQRAQARAKALTWEATAVRLLAALGITLPGRPVISYL